MSKKKKAAARPTRKTSTMFPGRIRELLDYVESENLPHIVSWVRNDAFQIHNQDEMLRLLSIFFGQTHYRSFTRQLNIWRFRRERTGPHKGAYTHPYFLRDDPEACSKMRIRESPPLPNDDSTNTSDDKKLPATKAEESPNTAFAVSIGGGGRGAGADVLLGQNMDTRQAFPLRQPPSFETMYPQTLTHIKEDSSSFEEQLRAARSSAALRLGQLQQHHGPSLAFANAAPTADVTDTLELYSSPSISMGAELQVSGGAGMDRISIPPPRDLPLLHGDAFALLDIPLLEPVPMRSPFTSNAVSWNAASIQGQQAALFPPTNWTPSHQALPPSIGSTTDRTNQEVRSSAAASIPQASLAELAEDDEGSYLLSLLRDAN